MSKSAIILLLLLPLMLLCLTSGCRDTTNDRLNLVTQTTRRFPLPTGYVNDFANILSEDEKLLLAKMAARLEAETTAQTAVVTIESFNPYDSIEQYATALFNEWGIGHKNKNNGVLLLVALKDRATRIEVGYGLEKTLTNPLCKETLVRMRPRMARGAYFEGIRDAFLELILLIEKDHSSQTPGR